MKHVVTGLAFACLAAVAAPAQAAYPNGGIYTLSQGGGTNAFRTINSQLTRQGGFIFTTHNFNYWTENIFAGKRQPGEGFLFTAPVATRFMGPEHGFNMYGPPGTVFQADLAFNVLYFPPGTPNVFNVTATAQNREANWVLIDHPLLNGHPTAFLAVQQVATYGVGAPPPRIHGVWYHTGRQRWAIFHEDQRLPMELSESFDVFAAPDQYGRGVMQVVADATNIRGNAVGFAPRGHHLIVTQNWAPRSVYNNHPVGVRTSPNGYEIYNEDNAPMPVGAAFNVVFEPL